MTSDPRRAAPSVALFHSTFGLRPVELAAAERLRAAGCHVAVPDLFDGATAPADVQSGSALMRRVGWDTILGRARRALDRLPDNAVLAGFSMGVGVVGSLWPERLEAAGVFCLHAPTIVPEGVRPGTPVQVHVAADDRLFSPPDQVAAFTDSAARRGAAASLYTYDGAGHFFTDEALPDYNAAAAERTWARVQRLISGLNGGW